MKVAWTLSFAASLLLGCVADVPPATGAGGAGTGSTVGSGDAGGDPANAGDSGGKSTDGGRGAPSGDGGDDGGTGGGGASCAALGSNATCAGSSVCCAAQDPDDVNPPTVSCRPDAAACTSTPDAVVVACRSADDCTGGDVCCGRKTADSSTVYASVRCEASCTGTYSFDHELFCDPADPHACDGRPGYAFCTPSDLIPGLYGCHIE